MAAEIGKVTGKVAIATTAFVFLQIGTKLISKALAPTVLVCREWDKPGISYVVKEGVRGVKIMVH